MDLLKLLPSPARALLDESVQLEETCGHTDIISWNSVSQMQGEHRHVGSIGSPHLKIGHVLYTLHCNFN